MDFLNDYNGQIMEEDIEFIKIFLTNIIEKKKMILLFYYLEIMLVVKHV